MLVRFVDDQNRVVRKVSQHYEITGAIAEIDGARQGEILFYRESELPPGLYTMETVVHDALSGKSSVRFSTVEVPKHADSSLRISSLVLVKRGEKVAEKERPRRQSAARQGRRPLSEPRRPGEQGREGARLLFRRLPRRRTARARTR